LQQVLDTALAYSVINLVQIETSVPDPWSRRTQGHPGRRGRDDLQGVLDKDLYKNCVFGVATTGDKFFAEGYHFEQELRLYGTKVEITGYTPAMIRPDRSAAAGRAELPRDTYRWLAGGHSNGVTADFRETDADGYRDFLHRRCAHETGRRTGRSR